MPKKKTPDYTRKAIDKYMESKEKASVLLPLGTKERIKAVTDESVNAFINRLVAAELERLENEQP